MSKCRFKKLNYSSFIDGSVCSAELPCISMDTFCIFCSQIFAIRTAKFLFLTACYNWLICCLLCFGIWYCISLCTKCWISKESTFPKKNWQSLCNDRSLHVVVEFQRYIETAMCALEWLKEQNGDVESLTIRFLSILCHSEFVWRDDRDAFISWSIQQAY